MANTKHIYIYLQDIHDDFATVQGRRIYGGCAYRASFLNRGGKFLVIHEPAGNTVVSSLN